MSRGFSGVAAIAGIGATEFSKSLENVAARLASMNFLATGQVLS